MKKLFVTLALVCAFIPTWAQFNYPTAAPMWFYLARMASTSMDTTSYPAATFPGIWQYRQQPDDTAYWFSNGKRFIRVGKQDAPPIPTLQDVTAAGNISPSAIALNGLSENIPTSGGNMLLLRQGDGEAYIESVDKPSNTNNPLNFNSSTHRVNAYALQYLRTGGGLMLSADNTGILLSPADASYSNTFSLSAGQNSENITNLSDNNSIQITRQPNYFNSTFTLNGATTFNGSLNAQASHFHFNSIRNFDKPAAQQQELAVSSDLAPSTTADIFNIKYRPVNGSLGDKFKVDTVGNVTAVQYKATSPGGSGSFTLGFTSLVGPNQIPMLSTPNNFQLFAGSSPGTNSVVTLSAGGIVGIGTNFLSKVGNRIFQVNGDAYVASLQWQMDTSSITADATIPTVSKGTYKINNSGSGTINITLPTASDNVGKILWFKIAVGGGAGGGAVNINGVPVALGSGNKGPLAIVQVSATGTAAQWEYLQGF